MRPLGIGLFIALAVAFSASTLEAQATHSLVYSTSPDRSNPLPLAGATVTGEIYAFIAPQTGVKKVVFYLDTPSSGPAFRTEGAAPWDFNGTGPAPAQAAIPFSTATLPNGAHTITAVVTRTVGGSITLSAQFTVANQSILFQPNSLSFNVSTGAVASSDVVLQTTDGSATAFTASVSAGASWLGIGTSSGTTPATISVNVDTTGLALGTHLATVTATSALFGSATLAVELVVYDGSIIYEVLSSPGPDRVGAAPLADGAVVSGDLHVFTAPETGILRVRYYWDDPAGAGTPYRTETGAPFDLNGTGADNSCLPFPTAGLWDGPHTLTAQIDRIGTSTLSITRNIVVSNNPSALSFGEPSASLVLDQGMVQTLTRTLTTTDGTPSSFVLSSDASSWLTATCVGCSPANTGTTVSTVAVEVGTAGLSPGVHTGTITAVDPQGIRTSATLTVTLTVVGQGAYSLLASSSTDRSGAISLAGATLSGSTCIFLSPESGVTGVSFYIDNPTRSGAPFHTEGGAPWDLVGGSATQATPLDTTALTDGAHTITAAVTLQTGTVLVVDAGFLISNGPPALAFSPATLSLALDADSSSSRTVSLVSTDGSSPSPAISSDSSWLSATPVGGGAPGEIAIAVDTALLAAGSYIGNVTATAAGLVPGTLTVTLVVLVDGNYDILYSASPNRSNAADLSDKNVFGSIYAFVSPTTGVSRVDFYIDDPTASGVIHKTENTAPYDLEGGTVAAALPFSTAQLSDGLHSITAVVTLAGGGSETVVAPFTVANGTPALVFAPQEFDIVADASGLGSAQAAVATNDGSSTGYTLSASAPWLATQPSSASTGTSFQISVDAAGLAAGTHTATITASAPGYLPAQLAVRLTVPVDYVYDLAHSATPDLASPLGLAGATLAGDVYLFVDPPTAIGSATFYLDDPDRSGTPYQVDSAPPFLLSSGALPFDTTTLSDGAHIVTVVLTLAGGGQGIIEASFFVQNGLPSLFFGSGEYTLALDAGASSSVAATLGTSNGAAAPFTVTESASWLTAQPSTGSTPATITLAVDTNGLSPGFYSATVDAAAPGFLPASTQVNLSVQGESIYDLWVSASPDRSSPSLLDGGEVDGAIYVFTGPDTLVDNVRFFIDNPTATGTPYRTENNAPFDLGGGNAAAAGAFDTFTLADGPHTITALLDIQGGGTDAITASFLVLNDGPGLTVTPSSLNFFAVPGDPPPLPQTLGIATSTGEAVDFSVVANQPWVTVSALSGTTPALLEVSVDPTDFPDGGYPAAIQITSAGLPPISVPLVLTVGSGICDPLPCSELLVSLPHILSFDEEHGGVPSGAGEGTGFTMILPSQFGVGYIPANIGVDLVDGRLTIESTDGSMSRLTNTQDNALGVGIDAPSQVTLIRTRMIEIPPLTGALEQFGLWFGTDDRNVLRLFVNSSPQGDRVRFLMEVDDEPTGGSFDSPYMSLSGATVDLGLRVDPVNRTISATYSINQGLDVPLGSHEPPPEFFSFDAAGINPEIGTRSFSGIFASHRNAPDSQTFSFDQFSVEEEPLVPPQSEIAFTRSSFPQSVPNPTSMVVGPDGRLYVLELTGTIHAFALGANRLPTSHQVIPSLVTEYGPRLALGIAVEPSSTSSDVRLWVCHSGPDPDAGEINSGTITRLSGPGFGLVEDVIVGLPRAFANHAPNSLHFGPDGLLYITIGGNTGSGAPNNSASEFGTRMEQYLSAALLAADVFAAPWPIDCFDGLLNDNPLNQPDIPPCAEGANPIVRVYSSGLRNLYDFTFHPNGYIYGPDNGLGVTGTYPPTPFVPCFGPASTVTNNPGEQPDLLLLLEEGMYYGHPNPSRDECVYKDGSLQGVPPLPNYRPPMAFLGEHKSANGIIAYGSSSAFCGALQGDLLITNYSVGDDLVRVQLAEDGRSMVGTPFRLVGGFDDPLPVTQSPDGAVFVGEFGANRITVLVPTDTGCWSIGPAMPQSLLDISGVALDNRFYVVAGKTSAGPVSSLLFYDPATGLWNIGPERPGAAVENPAVVAHDGMLYVFGGSTSPFAGMVAEGHRYDPNTGVWSSLPPMPTPRGGATAQVLGGLIYVMGGMGADGASVGTVEVFDPIGNAWSTAAPLPTPRDNPGSAVLDGRIYVFGGRIRNSNGSVPNGTLTTTEMYDPSLDTWSARAPMPTGRRTFSTAVLGGRALVLGGEATSTGGAFPQNEEYDPALDTWRTLAPMPTPRHGTAAAVIFDQVYVAGGGIVAGSSFSNILEIFSFSSE